MMSLEVQKFVIVRKANLSIFLIAYALVVIFKNHCLIQDHKGLDLCFFQSFIVLAFGFKSLICFKFVYIVQGRNLPSGILMQ